MDSKEITYDELVNDLSAYLTERYRSIAEFTRHADFLALGYGLEEGEKVETYFSRPKNGAPRKTKSAKMMVRLAAHYLERKITVKTLMQKRQVLTE